MTAEQKQLYRVKKGFGPHQIPGGLKGKKITKQAGETFEAYPSDRHVTGWAHKLEVIEQGGTAVPIEEKSELMDAAEAATGAVTLQKKALGGGWYDVINPETGNKINDHALREKDADILVGGGSSEEEDNPSGENETAGSTDAKPPAKPKQDRRRRA